MVYEAIPAKWNSTPSSLDSYSSTWVFSVVPSGPAISTSSIVTTLLLVCTPSITPTSEDDSTSSHHHSCPHLCNSRTMKAPDCRLT
ncbi:hypothetical protein TorRG33x02_275100 [Trema orientale]|uniref:Uncharacterized protein n=1 Tax=Trema orientale TaxID=63057 RepID=A0A2P5CRX8_TREOI|nr:hypothetical protein TorRG33x02_275100 [Trema orientale]